MCVGLADNSRPAASQYFSRFNRYTADCTTFSYLVFKQKYSTRDYFTVDVTEDEISVLKTKANIETVECSRRIVKLVEKLMRTIQIKN